MKPETLRSLLTDRALGELPPETGELLDAYLDQNPACAVEAARCGETARLARAALTSSQPAEAGAALRIWTAPEEPDRRAPRFWMGLAASLALGLLIGRFGPPARWSGSARQEGLAEAAAGDVSTTPVRRVASTSIWSIHPVSTLPAREAASPELPLRLRWRSPIERPLFEEHP